MSAILGGPTFINHAPNPYYSDLLRSHTSHTAVNNIEYHENPYPSSSLNISSDPNNCVLTPLNFNSKHHHTLPTCTGCGRSILDQYLYRICGQAWHETCAVCSLCSAELSEVCFSVNKNELLCHRDYDRLYATRCANCLQPMRSHELFMRARYPVSRYPPNSDGTTHPEQIYHVSCFTCYVCQQPIAAGDAYTLDPDINRPICRLDYLNKRHLNISSAPVPGETCPLSSTSQQSQPWNSQEDTDGLPHRSLNPSEQLGDNVQFNTSDWTSVNSDHGYQVPSFGSNRRMRTSLTDEQRYRLQEVYESNSRPSKKIREDLASNLGVPLRVIQVWFQNQRARDKRDRQAFMMHRLSSGEYQSHTDNMHHSNPRNHESSQNPELDICAYTPSPHTSVDSGPFPEFGGFSSENISRILPNEIDNRASDLSSWRSVSNAVWLVEGDGGEHSAVR